MNAERDRLRVLLAVNDEAYWETVLKELQAGNWDLDLALAHNERDYDGKLNSGRYDLILADLGNDGIQNMRSLRKCRQRDKDIPFIVLADDFNEADIARYRRHGASDCVRWRDIAQLLPIVRRELAAREQAPAGKRGGRRMTDEVARREELALLGRLTGCVATEMRQPLTVIRSAVYFLNMHSIEQPDEKVRKYRSMIWRAVETADDGVSELLCLAEQRSPEPAEASPAIVTLDSLSRLRIPKNVTIETAINESVPGIPADPIQVARAVVNILRTALEAMPEGGRLGITVLAEDPEVIIRIRDTGSGIPEDVLRQVYDPQFTSELEGRALRLAVARSLVERNGGVIEIQREEEQGTIYELRFLSRRTPQRGGGAHGG